MGTAREFCIFDLFEDGRSVLVDKRKNTSPEEDENESKQGRIKRRQHLIETFRLLFEAKKREQKDKERL